MTAAITVSLVSEQLGPSLSGISRHLKYIFESGELFESATCKEFLQVQTEGS